MHFGLIPFFTCVYPLHVDLLEGGISSVDMGSKLLISGSADCTLRVIDITAKKYLFPIHTGEKFQIVLNFTGFGVTCLQLFEEKLLIAAGTWLGIKVIVGCLLWPKFLMEVINCRGD